MAGRNRAALVIAAREIYAAHGLGAPLSAIARRAGVGQGVLRRSPHMTNSQAPFPDALAELRRRFRLERERRVRPDGTRQYRAADAGFGYHADDPYAAEAEAVEREPLRDRVDVAVVGGGFGGILAGAPLRRRGIGGVRVLEKGGDFGRTWRRAAGRRRTARHPGRHAQRRAPCGGRAVTAAGLT